MFGRCTVRKIFLLLVCLFLFTQKAHAVQEVVELNQEHLDIYNQFDVSKIYKNLDRIQDNSIIINKFGIDRVDLALILFQYNEMTAERNKEFSDIFNFGTIAPGFTIHFNDKKTRLGVLYCVNRELDFNDFFEKFSMLYLEHDLTPNQHVSIGMRSRLPVGYEGSLPSVIHPFVMRSQIARKFGNVVGFGLTNIGDYKYMNYHIGVYDGSRFFNKLFNGSEFSGMVQFKPLAKFDDKYGRLKIGTSIDTGNADGSFNVFTANALYEYKKFYWDFEYAFANGVNSVKYSSDKADGFYTTLGYNLTDKLKVLARYDYFKNQTSGKSANEYSAGLTYFVRPGISLMANYVLVDSEFEKEIQHKIYLGTRFNFAEFMQNLHKEKI